MKGTLKTFISMITVLVLVFAGATNSFALENQFGEDAIIISGYNPNPIAPCVEIPGSPYIEAPYPSSYPCSATAALIALFDCCGNASLGTGFLVSNHCMMTAAHVLYCRHHHTVATQVYAKFGYSQSTNTQVYLVGAFADEDVIYVDPQYYSDNDKYDDWGYVVFDENIGSVTGYFGILSIPNSNMLNLQIAVAGYNSNQVLMLGAGPVIQLDNNRFLYTASTGQGQSGGPVFHIINSTAYAVGIHTRGNEISGANGGIRFTEDIIQHLQTGGYIPST